MIIIDLIIVKRNNYYYSILITYVDDIVLTCDDEYEIKILKNSAKKLEIKDIWDIKYFLLNLQDPEKDIYAKNIIMDLINEIGKLGY